MQRYNFPLNRFYGLWSSQRPSASVGLNSHIQLWRNVCLFKSRQFVARIIQISLQLDARFDSTSAWSNQWLKLSHALKTARKSTFFVRKKTWDYNSLIKKTRISRDHLILINVFYSSFFRTCAFRIADLTWITFNHFEKSLLLFIRIKNVFLNFIFWS